MSQRRRKLNAHALDYEIALVRLDVDVQVVARHGAHSGEFDVAHELDLARSLSGEGVAVDLPFHVLLTDNGRIDVCECGIALSAQDNRAFLAAERNVDFKFILAINHLWSPNLLGIPMTAHIVTANRAIRFVGLHNAQYTTSV